MTSIAEKGGGTFEGIKMLLCENPLPPIEEAVAAAQAAVAHSNYYTEPYSGPLRRFISERIGVQERLVHVNAGSELILRQLFDRLGERGGDELAQLFAQGRGLGSVANVVDLEVSLALRQHAKLQCVCRRVGLDLDTDDG